MNTKKVILLASIVLFLNSCGGTWDSVKRGLTGQKQNSTDEFLVEKKDPLIMPPDFEFLPTPQEGGDIIQETYDLEKTTKDDGPGTTLILHLKDFSKENDILADRCFRCVIPKKSALRANFLNPRVYF